MAFSRQCWQYSYDPNNAAYSDPSVRDMQDRCENSMAQYGFTGTWWQHSWNDPMGSTYPKTDADGNLEQTLTVAESTAFGYFNLCIYDSTSGACSPNTEEATVYLEFSHPSFRWPRSPADAGVNAQAPHLTNPNTAVTTCDATGAYAPVLTFPAAATTDSEGADDGDTRLGRITPTDPPPPVAPPAPPHPPASPETPEYFMVFLESRYRDNIASYTQPFCNQDNDRHVTTGRECYENAPDGYARDPAMLTSPATWNEGYRCALDGNGTWKWTDAPIASLSGLYLCRTTLADTNGYLYSAPVKNIRGFASTFHENVTIPFVRGVRSTDIAYVNTLCGVFCAVDKALVGALTINGTSCSTVTTVMVAYSDPDFC